MRTLFLLILGLFLSLSSFSQYKDTIVLKQNDRAAKKRVVKCKYGRKRYMDKHMNQRTFIFKRGLRDGMYIAFYDKAKTDTAMVGVIENGLLNGVLYLWDEGKLSIAAEFKDGVLHGWHKTYFYYEEGTFLTLEKCEEGVCSTILFDGSSDVLLEE